MSEAITADIPLRPVAGLKPIPLKPEPPEPAPTTAAALTPPPPPEPPGFLTKLFAVFGLTLTRRQAGVASAAIGSLLLGIVGVKLLVPTKQAPATQPLAATTPEPPKPAPTSVTANPGTGAAPPALPPEPAKSAPPVVGAPLGGGSAPIIPAYPLPSTVTNPPGSVVVVPPIGGGSTLPPATLTAEHKPDPLAPPSNLLPPAAPPDARNGGTAATVAKPDPLLVPPLPVAAGDKWTRPSEAVTPAGGPLPVSPLSPGGPPPLPGVQPSDITPASAAFPAPLPVGPKLPAPGGTGGTPVKPPAESAPLGPPAVVPPEPSSLVPLTGGTPSLPTAPPTVGATTPGVPPIGVTPPPVAVPPIGSELPVVPALPVGGGLTPPVSAAPPQPKPLIPDPPTSAGLPPITPVSPAPASSVPPITPAATAPPLSVTPEPAAFPKTIDPPAVRTEFTKTAGSVETKPLAASPSAPTTTFDVDLHTAKASDTYDSISREFYNDAKYAVALKQYNGGRPLGNSTTVEVPPIHVLKKKFPGSISTAAPSGVAPNWGSAAAPVTPTGGARSPEFRASKSGAYTVPATGATFRQIARLTLNREERWTDIWDMNRQFSNPDIPLPPGTVVKLPSDARVPE